MKDEVLRANIERSDTLIQQSCQPYSVPHCPRTTLSLGARQTHFIDGYPQKPTGLRVAPKSKNGLPSRSAAAAGMNV